jgi:DNA-binding phage protein
MTKTTTTIWDPAAHLSTADDVAAYLEAALQDGDSQLVAAALGDIARAKGMSQSHVRLAWAEKVSTSHCPPQGIQNWPLC